MSTVTALSAWRAAPVVAGAEPLRHMIDSLWTHILGASLSPSAPQSTSLQLEFASDPSARQYAMAADHAADVVSALIADARTAAIALAHPSYRHGLPSSSSEYSLATPVAHSWVAAAASARGEDGGQVAVLARRAQRAWAARAALQRLADVLRSPFALPLIQVPKWSNAFNYCTSNSDLFYKTFAVWAEHQQNLYCCSIEFIEIKFAFNLLSAPIGPQSHASELLPLLLHFTSHASPPSVHALAIRILAHILPLLNSDGQDDEDDASHGLSLKSAFAALEPVWRTALLGSDQARVAGQMRGPSWRKRDGEICQSSFGCIKTTNR